MCGICGAVSLNGENVNNIYIDQMISILNHRGPDSNGKYVTDKIMLGHTRLAVLDLSSAGHQPMIDNTNSIVLSYNGEIYNFKELKNELQQKGYKFKSKTDTEVVLYSYKEWGIYCIHKFNGMFAFALWDKRTRELFLVRDRYGIKPLYYTIIKDVLVFASEIKSILEYGDYKQKLDFNALNEYFTFQNLFGTATMFKDIHMLSQGSYIKVSENNITTIKYWDFDFTQRDKSISFDECKEKLLFLFEQAVQRQLVSDVPVGSMLSGGMDSGSITAVASKFVPRLSTFTAGFDVTGALGHEATIDERQKAELMANLFKTQQYEQVINSADLQWILPKFIWHLEDLRTGMTYPHYYIYRLASKFVTVCLSGAGGDELYGGYLWRYYRSINSLDKEDFYKKYYIFWQRLLNHEDKKKLFLPEVYNSIKEIDAFDIFREVFMKNDKLGYKTSADYVANSLYFEIKTFMHGVLEVDDKLSMAHSLELRVPFLDNDLVDFSMTIPIEYKIKDLYNIPELDENTQKKTLYKDWKEGKMILREAMKELLPREILENKKIGFAPPEDGWYRNENREYILDTLTSANLKSGSYLNQKYIKKIINEHTAGTNKRLLIWSFLCFEELCKQFRL